MTYLLGIDCGSWYCVIGTTILCFAGCLASLCAEETVSTPQIANFDVVFEKVPPRYPNPWQLPDEMTVHVVDDLGEPIAGASILVAVTDGYHIQSSADPPGAEPYRQEFKTNEKGIVVIPFHKLKEETFSQFNVRISNGNTHIPTYYSLYDSIGQFEKTIAVSEKLSPTLPRGEMIPGRVVDENGSGIEGVQISSQAYFSNSMRAHYGNTQHYVTTSDLEGHFQIGPFVKEDLLKNLRYMSLSHPDYYNLYYSNQNKSDDFVFPETWVLKKKIEVFGRVLDDAGNPIVGAELTEQNRLLTHSDSEGNYRFLLASPSECNISVFRLGMKVTVAKFDPLTTALPFDIAMQTGNSMTIYAVDEEGNRIKSFCVISYFDGQPAPGRCLADGTWIWSDAPKGELIARVIHSPEMEDTITYRAEKELYRFRPQKEPFEVQMVRIPLMAIAKPANATSDTWTIPQKMVIRLTDYDTGLPCPNTNVTLKLITSSLLGSSRYPIVEKSWQADDNGLLGLDFSAIKEKIVWNFTLTFGGDDYYPTGMTRMTYQPPPPGPAVIAAPFPDVPRPIFMQGRFGPPIPEVLDVVLVKKEE